MAFCIPSFLFVRFDKQVKILWDVRFSIVIGEPLVGFLCNQTVSRICQSGITFCAFSEVPPVFASEEE